MKDLITRRLFDAYEHCVRVYLLNDYDFKVLTDKLYILRTSVKYNQHHELIDYYFGKSLLEKIDQLSTEIINKSMEDMEVITMIRAVSVQKLNSKPFTDKDLRMYKRECISIFKRNDFCLMPEQCALYIKRLESAKNRTQVSQIMTSARNQI